MQAKSVFQAFSVKREVLKKIETSIILLILLMYRFSLIFYLFQIKILLENGSFDGRNVA